MGRGGIDNLYIGIIRQCHRFNSRRIRQAQEYDVCAVNRILPGIRILSQFFRQLDQADVLPQGQTIGNAQTCCTGAAVNKYLCHDSSISFT